MDVIPILDLFTQAGPLGLAAVMALLYVTERKDRIEVQTRLYANYKENEQRAAAEIERLRKERDNAMRVRLTRTENDPPTQPKPLTPPIIG